MYETPLAASSNRRLAGLERGICIRLFKLLLPQYRRQHRPIHKEGFVAVVISAVGDSDTFVVCNVGAGLSFQTDEPTTEDEEEVSGSTSIRFRIK